MKLMEIYEQHSWLKEQIGMIEFIKLFPVSYKNGKLERLDKPQGFDLDRDIYLEVLVAFRSTLL